MTGRSRASEPGRSPRARAPCNSTGGEAAAPPAPPSSAPASNAALRATPLPAASLNLAAPGCPSPHLVLLHHPIEETPTEGGKTSIVRHTARVCAAAVEAPPGEYDLPAPGPRRPRKGSI